MAFITGMGSDGFGPFLEIEQQWYLDGFTWRLQERTNKTYRVVTPIDNTGGESPASTLTVGSDTYRLRSAGPERGYLDTYGLYTAVYWLEGTWSFI